MKKTLKRIIHWFAANLAPNYVAGPKLDDALRVSRLLSEKGYSNTIGFWNTEQDRPEDILAHYLSGIDAIKAKDLDSYISVKAWALSDSQVLLKEVFGHAQQYKTRVHFDSGSLDDQNLMFAAVDRWGRECEQIGCTLPGRWKRSLVDVDAVVERNLSVRVVKGQWVASDGGDLEPRSGCIKVVERLAGRAKHVAIATHDPSLAQDALQELQLHGTSCELELLYGLPLKHMIPVAESVSVPIRVYVPYGNAWLPYALEQARKKPIIFYWFVRDLLTFAKRFKQY
jgi:proline dehydrogenase